MSQLRFETWTMPGAEIGPENPLPPLKRGGPPKKLAAADYPGFPPDMLERMAYGNPPNYLPYTVQDRYRRDKQERPFRVAVLENELLRATFLLELGGRLRSLVHKPSGRELLEANPVFQPANLAVRNAWFSGGVEWNIGMLGHHPFTCAPLFAGRVEGTDGTPVLRLWEWERLRRVPYQIDAYLPEGSPMLLVRVRIANPNQETVPMYWWSNTAVPQTERTRVLTPATSAYNWGYGKGGPARVDMPVVQGIDVSYTTRIDRAADFFFHLEEGQRPWVAALDQTGRGLVQVSTDVLKGRKLFFWGTGPGGRRWQEFLSRPGHAYLEIQSGLARTQMEHLPMPAGAVWEWLEGYGLMEADPASVHGSDWAAAQAAVEGPLEALLPRPEMEAEFGRGAAWVDAAPVEVRQRGSGWGALERHRRQAAGLAPFCGEGLVFDDDSLGPLQAPWLDLLDGRGLGRQEADEEPTGYLVQGEWRALLEGAVERSQDPWAAWLHLGIMRYAASDWAGARRAWGESLAALDTPWARRNVAVLDREEGRLPEAVENYKAACRLRPGLIPLAIECGQCLFEAQQPQAWLDLLVELDAAVQAQGRVRLLEGQAALAVGDFARVEALFKAKLVIDDLREGERSLSHLWFEYHQTRLSREEGIDIDDALEERVRKEYPVPAVLDFRMTIE